MEEQSLRNLSKNELKEELLKYSKNLMVLKIQHSTQQLEDTSKLKKLKKIIAQINTMLSQGK